MYFIRHAQSQFNVAFSTTGRDPGIIDAPLTPHGIAQAKLAAKLLQGKQLTRIISSPYTRALHTAHILADALTIKKVHAHALLGERALYTCDVGTAVTRLCTQWPTADFSAIPKDEWWPKTGETQDSIAARVRAFMALEGSSDDAAHTLVVSHWYFLYTLSSHDLENAEIMWRDDKGRFHKTPL